MDDHVVIVLGLLFLVLILSFMRRRVLPLENFLPSLPSTKPKLYWFVDSEPNGRKWWDFQGRKSITPNRGYLEVSLEALKKSQGKAYTIVPLVGREATMLELVNPNPRAFDLPPALWRSYVISNLCAKKGGLVIDGNSVLTVGPAFHTKNVQAAMFGYDHDEPVAGGSAPGPDQYIGYAAAAHHPAWEYTLKAYDDLIVRGPQAWTAAIARRMPRSMWETQQSLGMTVIRDADGSWLPNGSLRQLEDYFGRSSVPENDNQALKKGSVYVVFDGDALSRRYEFNWFLRLQAQEIKSSDILWAKYTGL